MATKINRILKTFSFMVLGIGVGLLIISPVFLACYSDCSISNTIGSDGHSALLLSASCTGKSAHQARIQACPNGWKSAAEYQQVFRCK